MRLRWRTRRRVTLGGDNLRAEPKPRLRRPTVPWLGILAAAAVLAASTLHAQGVAFRVIVNEANPASSLSVREVSDIFLKKKKKFPEGFRALPVDQSMESAARASFSKTVHGRDMDAVRSYWLKMAFSGLGSAPHELASDAEVMDFVAHNVGGIGYVAVKTPLAGAVKAIRITGAH